MHKKEVKQDFEEEKNLDIQSNIFFLSLRFF